MSEKPFCPECDSGRIFKRTNKPSGKEDSYAWGCKDCEHLFSTPNYRELRGESYASGLAKELLEADPEDVTDATH